jgi:hypothetical protein
MRVLEWTGFEDFSEKVFRLTMSLDRDDWDREIVSHDGSFIKLHDRIPEEMLAIKVLILSAPRRSLRVGPAPNAREDNEVTLSSDRHSRLPNHWRVAASGGRRGGG